jgi:putative ABC transport system permease protein
VEVVGEESVEGATPRTTWLSIDPGYLRTLGLVLRQGRDFEVADRGDAAPVALVDEGFAARFFPDRSPLGERVRLRDREAEIVGVVSAVRQRRVGVIDGPSEIVYLPYAQNPTARISWLLRVEGSQPERIAEELRAAVWSLDPALPVGGLMTLDESIALSLTGINIFLLILGGFAVFALALAAMGLYGVLAYSVTQRRQEIGVRMAMGAGRASVLRMIVRQGMRLTVIGLVIGTPMAFGIRQLIVGSLGELASTPVLFLPMIVVILLVVAVAATLIPARRASGLAPTMALRAD